MFRAEIWLLTTLFALGVIVGMGLLMLGWSNSENSKNASNRLTAEALLRQLDEIPEAEMTEEEARTVYDLIKHGDRNLLSGNFHAASMRYRKARKKMTRKSIPLTIRLALCAENTAHWLLAESLYNRVVQSTGDEIHRRIATLGLIRIWQELDRSEDALRAASELFLQSESHRTLPIVLHAQLVYQLAIVNQNRVLKDYDFNLNHPNGLAFHAFQADLTSTLELIDDVENSTESDEAPVPLQPQQNEIRLIQRPGNFPNVVLLSADTKTKPLRQLLMDLGEVSQFEIQISAKAVSKISARSKSLHFRNLSLSLILDSLLSPIDLAWIQNEDNNKLQIIALSEVSEPAEQQALIIDAAERILRQFSISFPGDYRYGAVMLSRGNMQFLKGDSDAAANNYEMVAQSAPTGELKAKLSFNAGKMSLQLKRRSLALDQLYLAVDQSYDSSIKSAGYLLIGQLFLETNDLENATYAAGRALAIARDSKQKQLAALMLARIYLFKSDPASANQVLFNHRAEFNESKLKPTATILSNYSQYIGVEDRHSRNVAEERLIYSLANITDEQLPTFFDHYLAGRALQSLGFTERAIARFGKAASKTNISVWKNQILFALAIENIKAGQEKDSGDILEYLIREDSEAWEKVARLQLAGLYSRNDMSERCIAICEQLMALPLTQAERAQTLNMMGYAYRQLDQHHTAALCFAGIIPSETDGQQ